MITIHEFDPVIYPRNVWTAIAPTLDELKAKFTFSYSDEEFYRESRKEDFSAIGFKVIDKSTQFQGILMAFKNIKSMSVKTIAHKSVHIADYIYEEIGAYSQDFKDKNEPYCYLVGWIAGCIEKVRRFKKTLKSDL
jgi:hypothetical protein